MFANVLLDTEKDAFIKLLLYLSRIDGELSEEEITAIQQICLELDLDFSHVFEGKEHIVLNLKEILQQITSPLSKRVVILELVKLAHADKIYTETEHKGIQYIANILGVSEEKIVEIEEWVQEGVVWVNNGVKLISEEE
jgi:uncharacterized tellurite resistance protein B-like protein